MVTTNDSYLQLNIVPVAKNVPRYNEEQLFQAVEDEYYQIKERVDIAIEDLARKLALENVGNTTVDTSTDGYEYFPLDKSGINVPDEDNYVMLMSSYNADGNSISWGLPDSLGSRFGAFQLPWEDSIAAAGTGGSIPVLERFLETNNILPDVAIKTPAFDAAWKNFADTLFLKQKQAEFIQSETQNILGRLTRTSAKFQGWNINNLPNSVMTTVQRVFTMNNLNPFKNVSFMQNAFRGSGITLLDNPTIVSKMNTEAIFGADKYIGQNARMNVIPMDYGDLQSARAEGLIRQKLLADRIAAGDNTTIKGMGVDDIQAAVYRDYSIDQHIQNRMEGILAGEEPLPNIRGTIDIVDATGAVLIKNPLATGFSGEYLDETGLLTGVGGLPGSSDYNPLALGEAAGGTPIEKRVARAKTGIQTADGNSWGEPSPAYAAEYPHNQVTEHPTGIVIEQDNTPGKERITVYHPSHTYISIEPDGNITIRNAKDKFDLVDGSLKEYVKRSMDTTVDGNQTLKVGGNSTFKTDGNSEEKIGGEKRITAGTIYLNC